MASAPAVVLVLVSPQDIVNIASAVRIARNFGIERMRLVQPEVFDPWRIEGIAHNSAEFVRRIEIVDTLEAALADCVFTAVLSARGRTAKRRTLSPRDAAAELARESAAGPVAFVVGREDSGLTNAELDLGHVQVTIPTDPRSPSLNLAQAVALMAYEWWLVAGRGGLGWGVRGGRYAPAQAASQGGRPRHGGTAGGAVHRLASRPLGHRLLQDSTIGGGDAVVSRDRPP